jgi:hypothetical protein
MAKLLKSSLLAKRFGLGEGMLRWWKLALSATAVVGLVCFSLSCSSGSHAEVRFVHALQDAGTLDVDINGKPEFNTVSFLGVQPNQPGYTAVPSGSDSLEAFNESNNSEAFSSSLTLNGGQQYTLVATGFETGTNGANVSLLSIPDNIPSPPSGDVEFRVVHASPSGPGTVDVYIMYSPVDTPAAPITIKGLAYTQASSYYQFSINPNNAPQIPGFTIFVCASGSLTPIISEQIVLQDDGAARTLVLVDNQNGNSMSSSFLELSDIN